MIMWSLFTLMRPKQWFKNAFVLAPLFFSLSYLSSDAWTMALAATLCFVLVSSAVYVINDMHDVDEDRAHPVKKQRPVASGQVSMITAVSFAVLLLAGAAVLVQLVLPWQCYLVAAVYIALQLLYTFYLKHAAIFDVLTIASGFVLRVLMGGVAISVPVSPWIIVTTYLLALFLGFGKRYHEFSIEKYHKKRLSLKQYNKQLLEHLIGISCVSALMTYTIYAVEMARMLQKTEFVYTVVFVVAGLFRYLQVLYVNQGGGEPERVLLKDKVFLLNGLIWAIVTLSILAV